MANYQRGSEWRRWDLHLHTASSYDYNADDADELLVNALAENDIAAVAITDHFTIDKNRIEHLRLLAPNIVFFPGVELRTDKGGANIHVILIFSDICNLQTLSDDFDAIMLRNKAKSAEDNNKVYWDFNDITDFAKSHDALISLHTGKKTNGLDKEITNALEVGQAIKKEYSDNADIFEIGKISDITDYKSIVFPQIEEEKPLILCSDNHDPRSYSAKSKLWIKADVTFNGLKQIVFEPSERVCVSDTKPEQKSSYQVIESVKFVNNDSFQEEAIVFNQNLNCIIGGKSTGKSLLLHNMAMSIDPEQTTAKTDYINDADRTKSRKSKFPAPQVTVNWLDSNDSDERKIVYIPQKYLNRLADDEESTTAIDDLIEKIVLSKTDGDGQKLDTTQRSMQAKIDAILSNGAKGLIDISRYYSDVQAYNSKIKELGGELLVKQEIERLKAEIQDLSIKINLDEKDFLRYDEILRELADKEKTVQNLTKDIRLIQELDAVFHINEIGLNDEETLKTVATFLSDIESKANQLWIEERDKILQGIHARIALTNIEIEKLSAEKELLRPRIEGNNELSTKSKQLATEQEKLSAMSKKITAKMELHNVPVRLYLDKELFSRAIINVLDNAVEHTPDGGEIAFTAKADSETISFHISDSGVGFSEADIKEVTKQFYMSDKSRSTGNHYGMGLFITESIIKQHGGVMCIENDSVSGGGNVSISLPLQKQT